MTPPDDIPSAPTVTGTHGRAWLIDLELFRRIGTQAADAGVAQWVVEAPAAHPFWHSYFVSLVHLRPIPGTPDPLIYDPRATHELVIMAMDPDHPRHAQMIGGGWRWLEPANFAAQLIEPSDVTADAQVRAAVEAIVAGTLNPDTDALAQWRALFGSNMIRKEFR